MLARTEGTSRVLMFNRPAVRNTIDGEVRDELARLVADADADADADAEIVKIIITGTDPAFCGGLDLTQHRVVRVREERWRDLQCRTQSSRGVICALLRSS